MSVLLRTIETRAHPPYICARKFPCRLYCAEHAFRLGENRACIDSHDPLLRIHVGVEQFSRLDATGCEHFPIRKQRLGFQSLCLRNKHIAITFRGRHALQNNGVEQFGVEDDGICGHAKLQIMGLKSCAGFASYRWVTANRSSLCSLTRGARLTCSLIRSCSRNDRDSQPDH